MPRLAASAAAAARPRIEVVECPRDAVQGLRDFIPTEAKVRYHTALLKVGFDTLDCVSFVPPKAVPQLRDSDEVTQAISPLVVAPGGTAAERAAAAAAQGKSATKLLAVVANVRGAAKALQYPGLTFIGYPLSASQTFQQKNTNRSIADALADIAEIQKLVTEHNARAMAGGAGHDEGHGAAATPKQLGVCISMAFGSPYEGETVTGSAVRELCQRLLDADVPLVYFADTVGRGSAEFVADVFAQATAGLLPSSECGDGGATKARFGIHLHSSAADAERKLELAIAAGCRRFDGAILGLGGCPFAQDALVGNIATDTIVAVADRLGFDHGLDVAALADARNALLDMLPHLRSAKNVNAT
jgi:hydroxymethylglutaryl-CoA lyase